MRVTELLTKDTIAMDLMANDKNGVIDELVNQLDKAGKLTDVASFKEAIHNRESQSTTGIGEGIAIPHAKVAAVKSPAIAFGKSKEGVDYQSLDMQPAHLFFMIAAPEGGAQTHLDALAKLSGILMDENVREKLLHASSPEEVLAIIDHADDEATKEEEAEAEAQQVAAVEANQDTNGSNEPYVLAVTACPTGIAHTYMARDALKKQADKIGIKIKVDIIEKLNIVNSFVYVDYFNRDNIYFKVVDNSGLDKDLDIDSKPFIIDYLRKHKGKSGIIYCSTRKNVDDIYNYLVGFNRSVTKYHGGMTKEERGKNQKLFLNDDVEIMVATNAFGMGINKSNIRYVIHANIPADLESYYQEAGRAGRDGGPAEAILIYNEKDRDIQRYLMEKEAEGKKDKNYLNKRLKNFNKMLEYVELKTCYREYILKYFGEKMIRNYCGYCENCKKEKNIKDFSLEAKKIISGVGRAKESLGISTLANMLMGKADTKMLNKGLDKISTFGIMKENKQEWIESFINYMISEKYLVQSAGSFPVLKLGEKYKDILNGNIKVIRKEDEKIDFDYYENDLFKELNSLRKEISKQENIAPYIIFSDMTLIEMAEKKPKNRWDMLKIKGIGNQKFKS